MSQPSITLPIDQEGRVPSDITSQFVRGINYVITVKNQAPSTNYEFSRDLLTSCTPIASAKIPREAVRQDKLAFDAQTLSYVNVYIVFQK